MTDTHKYHVYLVRETPLARLLAFQPTENPAPPFCPKTWVPRGVIPYIRKWGHNAWQECEVEIEAWWVEKVNFGPPSPYSTERPSLRPRKSEGAEPLQQ